MHAVPPDYRSQSVETEALALWRGRRLPPAGGVLGPPSGPVVRQLVGAWSPGDFPSLVAHRALAADVDARYLVLTGRRVVGTLRNDAGPSGGAPSKGPTLLTALGIWTGGDGQVPWDTEDRIAGVQAIVSRLAAKGILVTRDDAFRVCPFCGSPRGPERIIYNEQEGDTFLVRFPFRFNDRTVNALVWVDAPWKLLGTSALLLNPDLPYVVAEYRRREDREFVLTSAASLRRLRSWIPEATFEVVEERPGRAFQGAVYSYPLRHEFPMGGDLTAPAGTVLAAADVSESGTGIVPLVPGHGPNDARIAARFGVDGWPLLTPKGKLDFTLMHKYAGLDLDTADEFVLRDLSEAAALFARLRVKRGVPHCAVCGTTLLWAPGRAWCLETSHLPPERRALFSRLLPEETLPGATEVAPWPVSEAAPSAAAGTVALLECARCDRLDGPGAPAQCPCGGPRQLVRRRLLPSSAAAFAAWARFDPLPDGDSVHLYLGQRRRVPALVNHLAALSGIQGFVGDVDLTVVPTVAAADASDLATTLGADAVRAAFVRTAAAEASGGRFADRCHQEAARIRRWWSLAQEVVAKCDASMLAAFARPIGGFLGELEIEDRAILARWERTRTLALAHYDHWAPALVHRGASRFLDNDLVAYRELVEPRLALAGTPTTKRAALRTLTHLLRGLSEVLAPILPFTSEAIHRALSAERTSLFEQPMAGLDRALLNDDLVAAWERWRTILVSVDRFRRSLGVPRSTVIPSVVLVVPADDVGDKMRADTELLARLARVERVEVASPRQMWTGRQRTIRPIESEIQKAYPAEASQIVHLLMRMPPRRWETAGGQEELTVVINGLPRRVLRNMVTFSDTLPPRVIPCRWPLGEMYVELPAGAAFPRTPIPPLSPDAFWLVRRLAHRLRTAPPSEGPPTRFALVTAKDPLATELRAAAEPIAGFLGLKELRVVEKSEEAVPPGVMTGRTRTGDRWWVHIPDLPARPRRSKHPRPSARMQRILASAGAPPPEFDYTDDTFLAHEEEVRGLGQELDDLIGIPLLGPSKVALAWDLGIHSPDDLRRSPFETVVGIPGFGGPIAEVVLSRLGAAVPPASSRGRGRTSDGGLASRTPGSTVVRPSRAAAMVPGESGSIHAGASSLPFPSAVPPEAGPSAPALVKDERTTEAERSESTLTVPPEPVPAEQPPATAPEPAEPDRLTQNAGSTSTMPSTEAPPVAIVPEVPSEALSSESGGSVREGAPPPSEGARQEASVAEMELQPPEEPAGPIDIPLPEVALPTAEEAASTVGAPSESAASPAEPGAGTEAPAPEEVVRASDLPTPDLGPRTTEETLPSEQQPAEPAALPAEPAQDLEPRATTVESIPEPPAQTSEVSTPEVGPSATDETPTREEAPVVAPGPQVELRAEAELGTPAAEPIPEGAPPEVEEGKVPPSPSVRSEPGSLAPEVAAASPGPPELLTVPQASEAAPASELEAESAEVPPASGSGEPTVAEGPTTVAGETSVPPAPPAAEAPAGPPETGSSIVSVDRGGGGLPLPRPETEVQPAQSVPLPAVPIAPATPLVEAVAPAPIPEPTKVEPPAPPSGVELMIGGSLVVSLGAFFEAAAAGHRGVCVVRESPERIRARVGSRPVEVYWLTNIGRGPALRPSDLEGAWTFLAGKLQEEHVTAFFLEGVEYLVRLHGADAVLNGLVQFDRLARENDVRIWVYLAPGLMKPDDLERFRATFGGGPVSG